MPGVEPGSQAWEACMMPLHYMRCDGAQETQDTSSTQKITQTPHNFYVFGLAAGLFFFCRRFWPRFGPDNGLEWPVRQVFVPHQSLTPYTMGLAAGPGLLAS